MQTNPASTLSSAMDELSAANDKHGETVSASATPHSSQHPQGLAHPGGAPMPSSRRGSPSGTYVTSRSVPATPLGCINGATFHLKKPGTPYTPDLCQLAMPPANP